MSPRLFIGVTLAAQLLWLGEVAVRVSQSAPKLVHALAEFGGTPPAITAAFLAVYPYAPLWIALLGALSLDVVRRPRAPQAYAMAVFGAATGSIWALLGWFTLAMYAPVRAIADAVR